MLEYELFDIEADPYEKTNLYKTFDKDYLETLHKELVAL